MPEQFMEGLLGVTAEWVHCHQLVSLDTAMTLAEDHIAAWLKEMVRLQ